MVARVVFETIGKVVVGTVVIGTTAIVSGVVGGVIGAAIVVSPETKKEAEEIHEAITK